MLSLLLGGSVWAEQLGYGVVGDVEVTHLRTPRGGGPHSLKFKMAMPRDYSDPAIMAGSTVQVFRGPISMGTFTLSEPDREDENIRSFAADGLYRKAETTRADNALGNATSDINEAITVANAEGLGWTLSPELETENLIYQRLEDNSDTATIADLLNAECTLTGKLWWLDEDNVVHMEQPPTEPEWAVQPGVPLMPITDETSVKSVQIRYLTGGTTQNPTSWETFTVTDPDADGEGRDVYISVAELGVQAWMPGQAEDWAQQYLDAMKLRITFADDLPLIPGELTNTGSVPIDFWAAPLEVLGKVGLHHGAIDKKRGTTHKTVQWICGSTTFRDGPGGGSLTIGPLDFAPRRVPDVIARMNDWYTQASRPLSLMDIWGVPNSQRPN
jgi:hypothetical protein